VLGLLTGCASRSSVVSETVAAVWAQKWGNAATDVIPGNLDLRYRYMRIEVQGRPPVLMVMGYADNDAAGEIETWYSAGREVIKTQNGRILSTAGLETDWVAVRFPVPAPGWEAVPKDGVSFQRERDQMPGYAFGLLDGLKVTPLGMAPVEHLPASLPLPVARTYQWFREESNAAAGNSLPAAWYARGLHRGMQTIVYSEQCLSPSLCLKMQRWPVLEATQ
jgi:Group 4 capsule polysaccharide lipoprotein gfcB, YjbF